MGDRGMYLKRLAGWWIGPGNLRCGERYAAKGVIAFALLLGLLANLTVMGSDAPSGIVLCRCLIARSASMRWSKRTNPTPLERPGKGGSQDWKERLWNTNIWNKSIWTATRNAMLEDRKWMLHVNTLYSIRTIRPVWSTIPIHSSLFWVENDSDKT